MQGLPRPPPSDLSSVGTNYWKLATGCLALVPFCFRAGPTGYTSLENDIFGSRPGSNNSTSTSTSSESNNQSNNNNNHSNCSTSTSDRNRHSAAS